MNYTPIGKERIEKDLSFYTLGKLMDVCCQNKDKIFKFIDTEFSVDELCSWRGSYNIPSLTYSNLLKTGKEIYEMLEAEIQEIHRGYKGGDYKYYECDEFYISNYGSCSEYKIIGHEIKGDVVILITEIDPY